MRILQYAAGIFLVLALLLCTRPATAGDAADGAICKSNSDCASGYCAPGPAIGNMRQNYCISRDNSCGAQGTSGFRFGQSLKIDEKSYKCVPKERQDNFAQWEPDRPLGSRCDNQYQCGSNTCLPGPPDYSGDEKICLARPERPEGALCSFNSDCDSRICAEGPSFAGAGRRYCIASDRSCGAPSTAGYRFGDSITISGRSYNCVPREQSSGGARWTPALAVGERCENWFQCGSNTCLPGPPDYSGDEKICLAKPERPDGAVCSFNSDCESFFCAEGPLFPSNGRRYCVAQNRSCGAMNYPGFKKGDIVKADNRFYRCDRSWNPYEPIFLLPKIAPVVR